MLNKVVLIGRLVRDPELRLTKNNIPVTSFRIAVDRGRKSSDSNQPTADFIDVIAWNKTAEFVVKYFNKGQLISVCGRLQTRNWKDKNETTHIAVEVVSEEIYFVGSKNEKGDLKNATTDLPITDEIEQEDNENESVSEDDLPF